MKKFIAFAALAVFSFTGVQAQDEMLFNHLAVGITTGSPGLIGFDVATTCTPYLQIRAGLAIMPNIKYSTNIKMNSNDVTKFNNDISKINQAINDGMLDARKIDGQVAGEYAIQGKLGWTNGKIMFDFFPFKATGFPFFITVGAYFGTSQIVSVYNKDAGALNVVNEANGAIDALNNDQTGVAAIYGISTGLNKIYGNVGEYKLGPDAQGDVKFEAKVNGFKPYLGIGFGRPFPVKKRIGFSCEIGCMFWKTPEVVFLGRDNMNSTNFVIDRDKAGNKDVGKAIDIISKFGVWPCINLRLTGKIF